MDKEILVKGLQELIRDYAQKGQTFTLVMLIPADPGAIDSKHTLLVSATWLDRISPKDAVNLILSDLIRKIGSTDSPVYRGIARITAIKTNDPFVGAITSAFNVSNSDVHLENCNVNGVLVERAIVLESHRPVANSIDLVPPVKVGRNVPCPCGSGKKFKRCCGENL